MRLTLKLLVLLAVLVSLAAVGAGWKWHGSQTGSPLAAPVADGWTWE
jgi:hypothetical protein